MMRTVMMGRRWGGENHHNQWLPINQSPQNQHQPTTPPLPIPQPKVPNHQVRARVHPHPQHHWDRSFYPHGWTILSPGPQINPNPIPRPPPLTVTRPQSPRNPRWVFLGIIFIKWHPLSRSHYPIAKVVKMIKIWI